MGPDFPQSPYRWLTIWNFEKPAFYGLTQTTKLVLEWSLWWNWEVACEFRNSTVRRFIKVVGKSSNDWVWNFPKVTNCESTWNWIVYHVCPLGLNVHHNLDVPPQKINKDGNARQWPVYCPGGTKRRNSNSNSSFLGSETGIRIDTKWHHMAPN